jgi:hypothetical protein
MITQAEVFASLISFAIFYPIIIFSFRDDNANKRKSLWTALIFIAAGLAIKLVSLKAN